VDTVRFRWEIGRYRGIICPGPCSLSPVNRFPGTGQDSSGRRKQDTSRSASGTVGCWQEKPTQQVGFEGIEVGSQSAGESELDPNPNTINSLPVTVLNPIHPRVNPERTASWATHEGGPYPMQSRYVK